MSSRDALQLQLDIAKELLSTLDSLVERLENSDRVYQDQATIASNMSNQMKQNSDSIKLDKTESRNVLRQIKTAFKKSNILNKIKKTSSNVISEIKSSLNKSANKARKHLNKFGQMYDSFKSNVKKNVTTSKMLSSINKVSKTIGTKAEEICDSIGEMKLFSTAAKFMSSIIEAMGEIKDMFLTGGLSIIKTGLKMLWKFATFAFSVFTSLVGAMAKLYKFAVTLPFTIAKIASTIGNKIRTDLVEVIGTAGQEVKESFDLTSEIGESASKLTGTAKGLLKTFETPRSRLSKLFGMGAQGAARFITETTKAVADMGHYADVFGPSLMGSKENAQYLIEMQRAMGLGANELAYYALQSYNSGKSPIDTLHETSQIIKNVADSNDLDFKALTKEFHTLRTNITEFGHLSSNEIGNLVGKLRKMKIKTEDAVNVFKKFTTFEDAAKASAMLFQTFEMNIDAFDLLTARDPGEMLQQFRDSMFATGKSFKDLNRHEKSLMSSITGISEHSLSSLMNFMDLGLTQDEARKKMMEEDPTVEQTKMIKGLSSTIKHFQKTIQFTSPFDAFFQGLLENQMNQKDLQNSLVTLSEVYSDIRHIGFSLDLSEVKSVLNPITEILRRIDSLVNGDALRKTMTKATSAAAKFADNVSYDLLKKDTSKKLTEIRYKIEAVEKLAENNSAIKAKEIKENIMSKITSKIDLSSLDLNILDRLNDSGVITKLKNGTHVFVEKATTGQLIDQLTYLSENLDDDKITSQLKNTLKTVQDSYNKQINKAHGLTKEQIEEEANKRTSIEGRVNSLYDDLLDMFKIGGPQYLHISNMGGNIMGSILRGLLRGIAAGFHMLAGASNKAEEILNGTAESEIKKAAGEKKIPVKKFSLKEHMGLTEVDVDKINEGLTRETMGIVARLPDVMSMAGGLLSDLFSVFGQFAAGILGLLGDMTIQGWEQASWYERQAMEKYGFNPEKAYYYKAQSDMNSGKFKINDFSSFAKYQLDEMNKSDIGYEGGLGAYKAFYDEMLKYYPKKSPSYKFLDSPFTRTVVNEVLNRENFKTWHLLGASNAEIPERAFIMTQIINQAKRFEEIVPNEYYAQKGKEKNILLSDSLIDKLHEEDNNALKLMQSFPKESNWETFVEKNYTREKEKLLTASMKGLDRRIDLNKAMLKMRINQLGEDVKVLLTPDNIRQYHSVQQQQANDIAGEGKVKIETPNNQKFILHPGDSFVAAKKGGFLNKVFIELTQNFNSAILNVIDNFNQTLAEVVDNQPLVLQESNIDFYESQEADEEDVSKLFEVYDEVINIINNRETIINQSKVVIQS